MGDSLKDFQAHITGRHPRYSDHAAAHRKPFYWLNVSMKARLYEVIYVKPAKEEVFGIKEKNQFIIF